MPTRVRATMRGFRRDTRAAAMVEFAIVAPLLFALIFGIIDFGRVFFLYNNLTNAAREGARIAAVLTNVVTNDSRVISATRARINEAAGATATVTVTPTGVTPTKTVRVRIVGYTFRPVSFIVLRRNISLNVTAEFRQEFQ